MSFNKDNRLNRGMSLNKSYWKYGDNFSHSFKIAALFAVNYVATIKKNQNDSDKIEKIFWDKRLESLEKKHHPIYLTFIVKNNNTFADLIVQRINSDVNKKVIVKSVRIDSKNVGYVYVAVKDSSNPEISRILILNNINKDILNEIRIDNPDFGLPEDMQQNGYVVPSDLSIVVRYIQLYCLPTSGNFVTDMCDKLASPLKKIFAMKDSISKIPDKIMTNARSDKPKMADLKQNERNSFVAPKFQSIESLLLMNGINKLEDFTSLNHIYNSNTELQNSLSTQSSLNNESQYFSNPINCTFEELLFDKIGLKYFKDFLKKEVSLENLLFWEAVQNFVTIEDVNEMKAEATRIFKKFMIEISNTAVNLEGDIVEQVRALLNYPNTNMFDAAKTHAMYLMKTDSFNRFKKSNFFDSWHDEYTNKVALKKASSTSSLTKIKRRLTFLPNLFKNKKEKQKKEDSLKSSQTFDSDSSNINLSSDCKITMASELFCVQTNVNKKLGNIIKKLDKDFNENDAVAFDTLDDRIIPFSESMLNMVSRTIIIEKSIVIRVGYVQINMDINLLEYVWFVIRPRHHLCLSTALDPIAKRLDIDLGNFVVIKEDDPHSIEWNTQIYILNKCCLFLIKESYLKNTRFFSKSLTNTHEMLWKKMLNSDAFLTSLPFDDDNIMDSRHEALLKYKLESRKVGYFMYNLKKDDDNFDTLTDKKYSLGYDDQRGICTDDQLTMPDFLKGLPRPESELSSLDSERYSDLHTGDSDLSFSDFDDFSIPSPSVIELVSDLE